MDPSRAPTAPPSRGANDSHVPVGGSVDVWTFGDGARVAAAQTIVGELLCEAVELHARAKVLDVATGSGNGALAAARRRGQVTAVDRFPEVLERARERARAEGLSVDFRLGDALQLPFEDRSFDVVLSTFGVMFADEPVRAASELVRVCRGGGRIGLASWAPDGFTGELLRITAQHAPGVGELGQVDAWGTMQGLGSLFEGLPVRIAAEPRSLVLRSDSLEAYVGFFRRTFGPTVAAFGAIGSSEGAVLERDLLDLVRRANEATDGTCFVRSTYLETVVDKAGGGTEHTGA